MITNSPKYKFAVVLGKMAHFEAWLLDTKRINRMPYSRNHRNQIRIDDYEYTAVSRADQLRGHRFAGIILYETAYQNPEYNDIMNMIEYTLL